MHNLNEEEKNPTLFQKTCYQQPFNTNSDSQIMMPKIKRYSEDKGKDDMPDIYGMGDMGDLGDKGDIGNMTDIGTTCIKMGLGRTLIYRS